jgi:hypothetical protein
MNHRDMIERRKLASGWLVIEHGGNLEVNRNGAPRAVAHTRFMRTLPIIGALLDKLTKGQTI